MSSQRNVIPLLLVALLILAGSGCTSSQGGGRAGVADSPRNAEVAGPAATRFQDTPLEGRTAVESAIELSEKYARLSDQTTTIREENQRLIAENADLLQKIDILEAKLAQTQKELGEANALLIEMLTELNNWKTNILGFRGEMRDAARAQLEALLKVLEILGGESEAGALGRRHAATLDPELQDSESSDDLTMSLPGEPNESQ